MQTNRTHKKRNESNVKLGDNHEIERYIRHLSLHNAHCFHDSAVNCLYFVG